MKRITLLVAAVLLATLTVGAQQTQAPVKMSAEYQVQLTELQQKSDKLAKDNASLISAWKDYVAQQQTIQSQATVLVTRAAMAAHMSVEQLDNSTLNRDDKGNYQWVAKPKAQTAEASKPDSGKKTPQ